MFNSLDNSKYLEQFIYTISYDQQLFHHISFLLKNRLFTFNSDTIINCYSGILSLKGKLDVFLEYIKKSISSGQTYLDNNVKFDIDLSKKLVSTLTEIEIKVFKDYISPLIFNNYDYIISLDVETIKIFENDITIKKDLLIKIFDNNIEFLKRLLEECQNIIIDYGSSNKDENRLKIARKYKISKLYPMFKGE